MSKMEEKEISLDDIDGFSVFVHIPDGMTLGEIVDAFIRVAFGIVAELYGSGCTDGDQNDRNPAMELFRAENCLRAVWRAVQRGSFSIELEEVA